jgi:hypothetical protein
MRRSGKAVAAGQGRHACAARRGQAAGQGKAHRRSRLSADGRALPVRRVHAGKGGEPPVASRKTPLCGWPANWPMPPSSRRSNSPSRGPTATGEARVDDRPARLDACHARHLGPFQRLPDLPGDSHPADPAGLHRRAPAASATSRPSPRQPPGLQPPASMGEVNPLKPLPGPPLGFRGGPEDLLVDEDGSPRRIDKAYSWDAPHCRPRADAHGDLQRGQQGPYGIDVLFMYMANMAGIRR